MSQIDGGELGECLIDEPKESLIGFGDGTVSSAGGDGRGTAPAAAQAASVESATINMQLTPSLTPHSSHANSPLAAAAGLRLLGHLLLRRRRLLLGGNGYLVGALAPLA